MSFNYHKRLDNGGELGGAGKGEGRRNSPGKMFETIVTSGNRWGYWGGTTGHTAIRGYDLRLLQVMFFTTDTTYQKYCSF